MKGSLVTSGVLHAIVLVLALVTLGKPQPFEVQDTESMPVDIVPIEELTKIQQGDKKAPVKDKSSPKPTTRQDKVDNAENAGDNNIDLKNPPTPVQRPQQNEAAAAPKPVEEVKPKQDVTPNEVKQVQKEETAAPPEKATPVPTPQPEPKPPEEAKPEPKPQAQPQETAKAEDAPLPDSVPLPTLMPKPEKPKPKEEAKPSKPDQKEAKAETKAQSDGRKQGKEKKETAKSAPSRETDQIADQVAALLNKEDAAGGGAKRSSSPASFGGKKTTGGSKLSQSEMDALRNVIQNNWNIIPGMLDASDIRIQVSFHLDKSGDIVGDPEVKVTGGSGNARDVLASSAKRAVLKSAPFNNLPADKYDAWKDVVVNFDPSDFM